MYGMQEVRGEGGKRKEGDEPSARNEAHRSAVVPLLGEHRIEPYLQSIVSIRREQILGFEALSRVIDAEGNAASPVDLLQQAIETGVTRDLDQTFLEAALAHFRPTHREVSDRILFVNAYASTVTGGDRSGSGLSFFEEMAAQHQIDPRNIAIELLETGYEDLGLLQDAVACCQEKGFLVALDDVGIGYSNLDRLIAVHPDLIKADGSLVRGVCTDYHKQEVFRALIQVSEKIGGWIVAEGVETEEDALCLLALGGDLLQGYYLDRPQPWNTSIAQRDPPVLERIHRIAEAFKRETIVRLRAERLQRERRHQVARAIVAQVESADASRREAVIAESIRAYPRLIESAALLDETGMQITDTFTNPRPQLREKTIIYRPAHRGANHALKEYFYGVMEVGVPPGEFFETNPYVPLPSGDLCITVSTRFVSRADGSSHVLCLHMPV